MSDGSAARRSPSREITPADREELRWYLEDYLVVPYAVYEERGPTIRAKLPGWGEALFGSVFGAGKPGRDAYVRARAAACELWIQPGGGRHRDSVSPAQALVWNAGTCAPLPRETCKWQTQEEPSGSGPRFVLSGERLLGNRFTCPSGILEQSANSKNRTPAATEGREIPPTVTVP